MRIWYSYPKCELNHSEKGHWYDGLPPNGLRFSCRQGARHQASSKNQRSRAPKAVSCKRLLGRRAGSTFTLMTK